jgi:hypothetical protein
MDATVAGTASTQFRPTRSYTNPRDMTIDAIRLDASTIEAIARRVAELVATGRDRSGDLLTVSEVAEHLGVSRAWVYENADHLGVIRLGGGKRPRLRFDSEAVRKQLDQRRSDRRSEPVPRGRRAGSTRVI